MDRCDRCECCGAIGIIEQVDTNVLVINDKNIEIDCHFTECKECNFCYASPEQVSLNKEIAITARRNN